MYILNDSDLVAFDKREVGYSRINVTDKIKDIRVTKGEVYAYTALPEYTIKLENDISKNIILKGYVNVVE